MSAHDGTTTNHEGRKVPSTGAEAPKAEADAYKVKLATDDELKTAGQEPSRPKRRPPPGCNPPRRRRAPTRSSSPRRLSSRWWGPTTGQEALGRSPAGQLASGQAPRGLKSGARRCRALRHRHNALFQTWPRPMRSRRSGRMPGTPQLEDWLQAARHGRHQWPRSKAILSTSS